MDLKHLKRVEDVERRAKQGMSEVAQAYFSAEAGGTEDRKVNEKALTRLGNTMPKPMSQLLDPSMTSEGIKWLKSITKLPVVVKGIMRGEDAVEAVRQGASAVIVSNHGARQIDGVCPSIDVLEEVVRAVKEYKVDVYLDGGIRTGSDIFRALALGAKAVFIGRPIVWGLSVAGEDGVRRVLEILEEEFRTTMCLAGASTLQEITRDMVVKEDYFSKL